MKMVKKFTSKNGLEHNVFINVNIRASVNQIVELMQIGWQLAVQAG